jgi:hypothetical protein
LPDVPIRLVRVAKLNKASALGLEGLDISIGCG